MYHQIIYLARHLQPTFLLEFQLKFILKNKCATLADEQSISRRTQGKNMKASLEEEHLFLLAI
jgi:hypothetical protein